MWGLDDEPSECPECHRGELGLCSRGDGGGFLNSFYLQFLEGVQHIVGSGYRVAV